MIKTTKHPSWVVQTPTQQIQDGGRPLSWKNKKSPYLGCGLTDFDKFWHGDAVYGNLERSDRFASTGATLSFRKRKVPLSIRWSSSAWILFILADIDECRGDNKCSVNARCINTDGSYTCECDAGYTLLADQRTCDGKLFLLAFTTRVRYFVIARYVLRPYIHPSVCPSDGKCVCLSVRQSQAGHCIKTVKYVIIQTTPRRLVFSC